MNRFRGYIHTLLPNTEYEFSIYAFNSTNYNIPSRYSKPILTKPITDTRELKFEASAMVNSSSELKSTGRFSKCSVIINYQQRRYWFFLLTNCRLTIKYSRLSNSYDICRFVHSQLRFANNNLFLIIKMVLATDEVRFIKIQLSAENRTAVNVDPDSIRLSRNIMNILSQLNYVFPTQFVER